MSGDDVTRADNAALGYRRAGLSVIATRPEDKRPCGPWKAYQRRRPTEDEVHSWYRHHPGAGVGIVCGSISGLVVVDGDPRNGGGLAELAPRLPPTPTVETGGGGRHYYFHLPIGLRVAKVPALLPGVDLQAEGSYVVAPPTVHPSGRPYRWLPGLALGDVPLAPLPLVVRHLLALHRPPPADRPVPARARRGHDAGPSLETVLSRLEGVRRVGSGWLARCPAHPDREPSLSVGAGEGGRLLLHCFAGCDFGEIVHALAEEAIP